MNCIHDISEVAMREVKPLGSLAEDKANVAHGLRELGVGAELVAAEVEPIKSDASKVAVGVVVVRKPIPVAVHQSLRQLSERELEMVRNDSEEWLNLAVVNGATGLIGEVAPSQVAAIEVAAGNTRGELDLAEVD